jgi:hypothetical protein
MMLYMAGDLLREVVQGGEIPNRRNATIVDAITFANGYCFDGISEY